MWSAFLQHRKEQFRPCLRQAKNCGTRCSILAQLDPGDVPQRDLNATGDEMNTLHDFERAVLHIHALMDEYPAITVGGLVLFLIVLAWLNRRAKKGD